MVDGVTFTTDRGGLVFSMTDQISSAFSRREDRDGGGSAAGRGGEVSSVFSAVVVSLSEKESSCTPVGEKLAITVVTWKFSGMAETDGL